MKSWDPVWEDIFKTRSWGRYPPEELVRFIAIHFYRAVPRNEIRILDLGCGTGACSWFMAREGFSVTGIDGSATAISKAQERFSEERLSADFRIGDFSEPLPWPEGTFHAVIDNEALSCNTPDKSKKIVGEVYRILKPGGFLFSMTFKHGCWGDGLGNRIGPHTYDQIRTGIGQGLGTIRFSSENDVRELYDIFPEINLEYSIRSTDNMAHRISQWVVTCKK